MANEIEIGLLNLRERKARHVPFGFKVYEDDSNYLEPIPNELEKLEKAKEFCKTCSLREVAMWLTAETGRNISHMGLRQIINDRGY